MDRAEVEFFSEIKSVPNAVSRSLNFPLERICAVDAAYDYDNKVYAVAVLRDKSSGNIEIERYFGKCTFPYVAGLFYLREGPFAVSCVRKFKNHPQMVCFDAHGSAHPRKYGLANICGQVLTQPSIGMAKNLLVGKVASYKNDLQTINYDGRTVGFATYSDIYGKRYWSCGYGVSLNNLRIVIKLHGADCLTAMSMAHRLSIDFRNKNMHFCPK